MFGSERMLTCESHAISCQKNLGNKRVKIRNSCSQDVLQNRYLQACNFIKKRLQYRCFSVKFEKFSRATSLQNNTDDCFCKIIENLYLQMTAQSLNISSAILYCFIEKYSLILIFNVLKYNVNFYIFGKLILGIKRVIKFILAITVRKKNRRA